MRPSLRRKLLVALAIVSSVVLSCLVWGFLIEPNRLVVRQETINIQSWPIELSGLRIAVIADIHAGSAFIDEAKMQRIVAETNQMKPDLIVLLGDYMITSRFYKHPIPPETTAGILKDLSAPLGVYAVLGNHDGWFQAERVRAALEQNGLRVLNNEILQIKFREGSFWLAGLADLWTGEQRIGNTLAAIPKDSAIIAMTHNPDIFPTLPPSVSILLAGHTHGGQVNLPIIGRPIVPSKFGQRYAAGHVFENGHHLFVTTGIGTSILPVRFRVTPEIVILTITP
jgi:predicted MPP superfamily phosphohydrolase